MNDPDLEDPVSEADYAAPAPLSPFSMSPSPVTSSMSPFPPVTSSLLPALSPQPSPSPHPLKLSAKERFLQSTELQREYSMFK